MEKKRLQFDFSAEAVDALDSLVTRTGAATRAETVRKALSLLDYVTQYAAKGGKVIVKDPSGAEREIVIL